VCRCDPSPEEERVDQANERDEGMSMFDDAEKGT